MFPRNGTLHITGNLRWYSNWIVIICIERQKYSNIVTDNNLIIGKQLNDYLVWRQDAVDCLQQNPDLITLNE